MYYIVVRIKKDVKVLFEEDFIDHNPYRTQNQIITVLSLLGFAKEDFDVELFHKQ